LTSEKYSDIIGVLLSLAWLKANNYPWSQLKMAFSDSNGQSKRKENKVMHQIARSHQGKIFSKFLGS
jgi:hypothetical protein